MFALIASTGGTAAPLVLGGMWFAASFFTLGTGCSIGVTVETLYGSESLA